MHSVPVPGHKSIEKEWIIPPSYTPDAEYNGYFIPGDVIPGSRISTTYDVNPEFIALCDRVCDAVNPTGRTLHLTIAAGPGKPLVQRSSL